jgi:hypothetical protein
MVEDALIALEATIGERELALGALKQDSARPLVRVGITAVLSELARAGLGEREAGSISEVDHGDRLQRLSRAERWLEEETTPNERRKR